MQEDVERRTVAITVSASKFTAKTIAKAGLALLHGIQNHHRKALTPHGRQSVAKLMNHNVSTSSLPITGETKLFDRIARKYNVDYAFHNTGPGKYTLFFKAGQADAITACFSEYTKRVLAKGKGDRSPIRSQLEQAAEFSRSQPRQRERQKEVTRDDR
ncbi:MAG: PcfB family protein [Oscillospiraceae bacterium]|nr:PcfB family protein [Oscillospiraceae bacterium]